MYTAIPGKFPARRLPRIHRGLLPAGVGKAHSPGGGSLAGARFLLTKPRTYQTMRLLLAIFLPPVVFFTIGRPFAGIFCLILMLTLIGWIPAAIWAVYALSQYKTDRKISEALGNRQGS